MAARTPLTVTQRTPSAAVAKQAEHGLDLRKAVSSRDIKSMYSYSARHQVDKRGKNWGHPDKPSAGYIAWLLWGGEAGKAWIDGLRDRLEKKEARG